MAIKPRKSTRKPKSGSISIRADVKYVGHEPEFKDIPDNVAIGKALGWYSYFGDKAKALEYALEHYEKLGATQIVNQLNRVGERGMAFIPQLGWICRMIDRGCLVPDSMILKLDDHLDELEKLDKKFAAERADKAPTATKHPKADVSHHMMLGDIMDALYADEGPQKITIAGMAEKWKCGQAAVDFVRKTLSGVLDEMDEYKDIDASLVKAALKERETLLTKICKEHDADKDAPRLVKKLEELNDHEIQLYEVYSTMKATAFKKLYAAIETLLKEAVAAPVVQKTVRAPRPPKVVPAEKQVKDMTVQESEESLGLVSKKPKDCIGKTRLWVYNTRYKNIMLLEFGEGGATASGSTFKNFVKGTSKTVRKPEEFFADFKATTAKRREKMFTDLKTKEQSTAARMGENSIIVAFE